MEQYLFFLPYNTCRRDHFHLQCFLIGCANNMSFCNTCCLFEPLLSRRRLKGFWARCPAGGAPAFGSLGEGAAGRGPEPGRSEMIRVLLIGHGRELKPNNNEWVMALLNFPRGISLTTRCRPACAPPHPAQPCLGEATWRGTVWGRRKIIQACLCVFIASLFPMPTDIV